MVPRSSPRDAQPPNEQDEDSDNADVELEQTLGANPADLHQWALGRPPSKRRRLSQAEDSCCLSSSSCTSVAKMQRQLLNVTRYRSVNGLPVMR